MGIFSNYTGLHASGVSTQSAPLTNVPFTIIGGAAPLVETDDFDVVNGVVDFSDSLTTLEETNNNVSVRRRFEGDTGVYPLNTLIDQLNEEIINRRLSHSKEKEAATE